MRLADMAVTVLGKTYTGRDITRMEFEDGRARITFLEGDSREPVEVSLPSDMVEFTPIAD